MTTHKSATRETPFALAFGTQVVAPVEVGIKSPRIELASVEHNDEALHLNLELLDEKREQVLRRTEDYQRKTARYYNKKSQTHELYARRFSLKETPANKKEPGAWKTRPQLGRSLHYISSRQAGQL